MGWKEGEGEWRGGDGTENEGSGRKWREENERRGERAYTNFP